MAKVREIADALTGFPFDSKLFSKTEGFPLIRIRNLKEGKTDTLYNGIFDKEFIVKKGDLLIGMDGEFNLVEWNSHDALLNQRVMKVIPNEKFVTKKYLKYALPKKLKEIEDSTPFVTVKHLSHKHVLDSSIPLPNLKSQQKIAGILEQVDAARQKRKQANQLTEQFLQSAFLEMFGDPVRNEKGWEVKNIGYCIKKIENENPLRFPTKQYSYIDISSIDNKQKVITETKNIIGSSAPSRARQLLKHYDIILSTVRPNLNSVAMVIQKVPNLIGSTGFCVLRANEKIILPNFLFEICKQPFFIERLSKLAKGASYPAVTDGQVLETKIPTPPLPIQQKFSLLIENVDQLRSKQRQSEKELDNLLNCLMQKYFG